ncbi:DUF2180 family protein [Streptomyces sp. NPDC018947]|uniref:DUF2180 family protein n=1 Tax=Streptomyces sp. NPDC018947 TaxID=3365054 RepID=UPI00379C0835
MRCLDCRMEGTANTAVGLCVTCGAAVCQDHVRIAAGSRRGPLLGPLNSQTRTVRCRQCGHG